MFVFLPDLREETLAAEVRVTLFKVRQSSLHFEKTKNTEKRHVTISKQGYPIISL